MAAAATATSTSSGGALVEDSSSEKAVNALGIQSPGLREIGRQAVWSLSTAKPGNGVEQIRDGSTDTYWQSDGTAPHTISVQFSRQEVISCIALYLNYSLDESYTPKQVVLRAGTGPYDLREISSVTLTEPSGWHVLPLEGDSSNEEHAINAFHVEISVMSMHQNGKDTHVRMCKIFGPRPKHAVDICTGFHFETVEHTQFMTIR